MFFYRIEDKSGNGIYRSNKINTIDLSVGLFAAKLCTSVRQHNPPDIDFPEEFPLFGGEINLNYKFGFKNLHQLYTWFDTVESINLFKRLNYQISKYKIDSKYTKISDTQLIFLNGKERFVNLLPFDSSNLQRKCDYSNLKKEQMQLIYKLRL